MFVRQISVFLENKGGRLAKITRLLAENNVDIRALSLADTADFGLLRLIVGDNEKAVTVLRGANMAVSLTEVLAVEMPDRPGALAEVLALLEEQGQVVEYAYAFVSRESGKAYVILRCMDDTAAETILRNAGIAMLDGDNPSFS